jgi:hypothetical protein
MSFKKVLYTLSALILVLFSCKKKTTPVPDKPYITNIYVVGFKVINYQSFGILWKDGQQVPITVDINSTINAVAVKDTDVYLAGRNAAGAAYWKNGKSYLVSPGGASELFAITVSGNDIYMAGMDWRSGDQYGRAAYWKNGVETFLTDGSAQAAVNAIAVNGTDVYLAGYYNQGQNANTWGEPVAACWKNNTLQQLDSAAISILGGATAKSVAVTGGSVYVAGYIGLTAALWKNGALQQLDHNVSSNISFAFCVALNGNDVYVSGTDANTAAYWKNGAVTNLISGAPIQSGVEGLYFQGTDRYMAGTVGLNGQPVYWINDIILTLQNSGEFYNVNGIAVSRHQ